LKITVKSNKNKATPALSEKKGDNLHPITKRGEPYETDDTRKRKNKQVSNEK